MFFPFLVAKLDFFEFVQTGFNTHSNVCITALILEGKVCCCPPCLKALSGAHLRIIVYRKYTNRTCGSSFKLLVISVYLALVRDT